MDFSTQVADFIKSLDYDFTPDFSEPKKKWIAIKNENIKGAYVFDVHILKDKTEVLVFTIYDYQRQQSFTEKFAGRELSSGELKNVDKKLEEQKKLALEEKERKWNECRDYCAAEWAEATEGGDSHPYLKRKGLDGISQFTRRTRTNLIGEKDILFPLYDSAGAFWGFQCIHESGEKQFAIGQRLDGVFYPINHPGCDASRLYICEGIATAISVAESLNYKFPVVACISASNMKQVARALRKKYDHAALVLCADNDKWKPHIGNTGVRVATEICGELDGTTYVVPDFSRSDESTKPTDFNDLHTLSGSAEVAKQILSATLSRPHILYSLGHNEGIHHFTSSENPQLQRIKEFSQTELLSLKPLGHWAFKYANEKGQIDWTAAKNDLIRESTKRGIFDPGRMRGRGIWKEDGQIVIHFGNRLYFPNGEEKDLSDLVSEHIYDPRPKMDAPKKSTLNREQRRAAAKVVKTFSWENEFEAELFMGWILVAPLAGIIDWRPHMALTAQAGSGKTTLITHIVEPCLRHFMPFRIEGTTEAGLRQIIKSDSIPVIIDEFDTNSMKEDHINKILNLVRAASSEGSVVRGTSGGKALRFTAKFCSLFAGVNMPHFKEADRTRITQLELTKDHKKTLWSDMQTEILKVFNLDWSLGFFWHCYSQSENLLQTAKIIQDVINSFAPSRTGQQYGTILAGHWHWENDGIITPEEAQVLGKKFKAWLNKDSDTAENDTEECLNHLFNLPIKTDDDRAIITLGQMLDRETAAGRGSITQKNKLLEAFGIRLIDGKGIFISNSNPQLRKHFDKTPWSQWTMSLKRLPSARVEQQRLGSIRARGLVLNWEIPKEEF